MTTDENGMLGRGGGRSDCSCCGKGDMGDVAAMRMSPLVLAVLRLRVPFTLVFGIRVVVVLVGYVVVVGAVESVVGAVGVESVVGDAATFGLEWVNWLLLL